MAAAKLEVQKKMEKLIVPAAGVTTQVGYLMLLFDQEVFPKIGIGADGWGRLASCTRPEPFLTLCLL